MSDLSTADLAGRTTPRTDERDFDRDAPMDSRPMDNQMSNVDELDGQPMGEQRFDDRSSTTATTTEPMTRPASTPTSSATASAPPPHERLDENTGSAEPLFPTTDAETFRSRWTEVQTGFVDEPRRAVEQADGLVAEMMKQLAEVFADERSKLEEQWSRGDDISTEDLRQALRRYRSFFDRLLSV
jgi:hypothetical protein